MFRHRELNPGLAGFELCMRAADASHYTMADVAVSGGALMFTRTAYGKSQWQPSGCGEGRYEEYDKYKLSCV
jgi:hypothetical protein